MSIFSKRPFENIFGTVYDEIDGAITSYGTESKPALTTTTKASLVAAINEVDAHADTAGTNASTALSNASTAQSTANAKYTKPVDGIPSTDMTTAVQMSLGLADTALQSVSCDSGTPVNAVASTGTLTVSGVVIDSQTVTIGVDTYEFCTDTTLTISNGNIAVDCNAVSVKAQGTLTVAIESYLGQTATIGTKVYTVVPIGTANADGEVDVGADVAEFRVNIRSAILGTDGHNIEHTLVSCGTFNGIELIITAKIGGVTGNSIATTCTLFGAGFDAVTLGTTTAGVDCIASNAITALVLASAGGTENVTLTDGAGDTVVVTCDTKGVTGNSIATTETMTNGAFGSVTLTGGINGTVGSAGLLKRDTSYLYVCTATNTIADANWRRISLGSVY